MSYSISPGLRRKLDRRMAIKREEMKSRADVIVIPITPELLDAMEKMDNEDRIGVKA